MKKIILLGFSILGISHFAGAWIRTTPQVWNSTGWNGTNSNVTVSCYNQQQNPCMMGAGMNPEKGQRVTIYNPFGAPVARGVLLRASLNPDSPGENQFPNGLISIFDVKIEELIGGLPE
ncbi:MAG: hypothetical protein BGO31_09795 [Bacteroidetes bacterium 43-16]|nr:MAG: hypothetical protein BGO31_09795 [Bacteroidetes bacterium 43-16]